MADTFWNLFFAYTVIWTLISVFALYLLSEQKKLRKRLEQLSEKLDKK